MITSSSDIVAKQPNKRAICSLMCYYYWGLGYYLGFQNCFLIGLVIMEGP